MRLVSRTEVVGTTAMTGQARIFSGLLVTTFKGEDHVYHFKSKINRWQEETIKSAQD